MYFNSTKQSLSTCYVVNDVKNNFKKSYLEDNILTEVKSDIGYPSSEKKKLWKQMKWQISLGSLWVLANGQKPEGIDYSTLCQLMY